MSYTLKLHEPHKSITAFGDVDLPDFTVITGLNGSGKTHLLEAITQRRIKSDELKSPPDHICDYKSFVTRDETTILHNNSITDILETIKYAQENFARNTQLDKNICIANEALIETLISQFHDRVGKNVDIKALIKRFEFEEGKFLIEIYFATIRIYFTSSHISKRWWTHSFGRDFLVWDKNRLIYDIKKFKESKQSQKDYSQTQTEDEFSKLYGQAPWDKLNSYFDTVGFEFHVNKQNEDIVDLILKENNSGTFAYSIFFEHKRTKAKIQDISNFSSGEKIILTLILQAFFLENPMTIIPMPDLLLLDEIDASLHPSMVKMLINTIVEIFNKKHNIKVILTTHSPTTVALAPEESIHVLERDEDNKHHLKKISKDRALSVLTDGIATLSVDYENRRHVFVESKTDEYIYSEIYGFLKEKAHLNDNSLQFITRATQEAEATQEDEAKGKAKQIDEVPKENCPNCAAKKDKVKEKNGGKGEVTTIVDLLKGNHNVYGLIDWDTTETEEGRIKILGGGQRYSIENYILDPIILAGFLWNRHRDDIIEKNFSDSIALFGERSWHHNHLPCTENLQKLGDILLEKIWPEIDMNNRKPCAYVGGFSLQWPVEFLNMNGHDYEYQIDRIFPELKRDYTGKNKRLSLKLAVVKKFLAYCPEFIPQDFVTTIKEIQKGE
ncbi:MAG: ATP-binding protein [Alphaproteobacteria bacterium]